MEANQDKLSPQQSLDIISQMIQTAQGNVSSASFYFLLWGWVIAFCNFGMYTIIKFTPYARYSPWIWSLSLPAWIITMVYASRQSKDKGVETHLDNVYKWLWISMAIAIGPVWVFGDKINWNVNAIVLMPIGIATFLSGVLIRFTPLRWGGVTFWIAGILCYFVSPVDQCLIGGVAVLIGYIVPGYMLRKVNR